MSELSHRSTDVPGESKDSRHREATRFSYAVAALERSIRRSMTTALQEFDLTVAQYTVLSLIRLGSGYSNAQLARRSFVSPQAMHEVISELESRGLLERSGTDTHRTMLLTYLTPEGVELLRQCDTAVDRMEQVMLAGIPDELEDGIIRLLMGAARGLRDGDG